MAVVISFEDVARGRRRRRSRELTRQCTRIIELNLRLAEEMYELAPVEERPVRARHLRKLSELLAYLVAGGAGELG